MTDAQAPVWFITGCSTGFGRELAKLTIERGWPTVVTARGKDRVADLADGKDHVLALDLDVTDMKQIADAVSAAEQKFGRIDVLVNNAGYGYQASIEEGEEDEIRAMFDANVFGLFAMTRAVLPGMRAQRKGHILNITSMAGFMGLPSSGYYSASKHAVEGFSDALSLEGAPLGIKVTCVEPGPFRTDWAGRSLKQTPSTIADYAETAAARMGATAGYSGRQPGDPVRAGEAMIAATEADQAPRHLVLGAICYNAVTQKLKERLGQIELWEEISLSADFPS
ncbi:oxidoreductase [Neorhizobium galegae]|uniref:oxidoreductase n=1 Tax=Neorhizobium galegae TaxID=399 RepID=UPI000621F707|nr:oxidoreductase [Neorhizobium galegae]CDZ63756.1 Short-chain dehydrogenase/reductase SDR [Neorhizobium galegae bv. orientalis]KAB1121159.1 SDR family NAD(P)-dependent oxidoreductase [Neorhizobium galegae]MCQ1807434.1 oxidoreductase [Neorhizobium galegae]MCQ1839309.1 oxidoreductase [Neorhizobium galegae]UIY31427.1 oxidoreductase [Neorhizobium galegae]